MTITPPNPGLRNNSFSWQPSDNNLLVASDPIGSAMGNSQLLTAGTVYLAKLFIRQPVTISTLWYFNQVAGVGASTGSFAGLYSSAGNLLTGSADIAALLTAAAPVAVPVPLTTPQVVQGGNTVWAAIVSNLATTQPTLARVGAGGSILMGNLNLSGASLRYAPAALAQTALPASFNPATLGTPNGFTFWAGAS